MNNSILEVEGLKVSFMTNEGTITVVKEISFDVKLGETLGIVGESGSGKSVTSLSIMKLIQSPPGIVTGKKINFAGQDILQLSEKQMQKIRGNQIGIIFQEPMTSLNPIHTCGKQIMEPLLIHKNQTKKEAKAIAIDLIKKVGIPSPERRFNEYPHQMSGGMRQRVMIAMALACQPQLLIADEPTTALDVTIQAQILELIKQLKDEINAGIIMITHDLGVVAEVCDKVIVMYAGEIMEQASVEELFRNPLHPYTRGLIQSIPKIEPIMSKIHPIDGTVPNPNQMPAGCLFRPRCKEFSERCRDEKAELIYIDSDHAVRCWNQTC